MDDERKLYVLTDLYTHETFARNTFTDEEVERLNKEYGLQHNFHMSWEPYKPSKPDDVDFIEMSEDDCQPSNGEKNKMQLDDLRNQLEVAKGIRIEAINERAANNHDYEKRAQKIGGANQLVKSLEDKIKALENAESKLIKDQA